jgi:hypothetical protein
MPTKKNNSQKLSGSDEKINIVFPEEQIAIPDFNLIVRKNPAYRFLTLSISIGVWFLFFIASDFISNILNMPDTYVTDNKLLSQIVTFIVIAAITLSINLIQITVEDIIASLLRKRFIKEFNQPNE